MTKKPMIMGFFTAFAKLFEKYANNVDKWGTG